jgi:hypothetical protein
MKIIFESPAIISSSGAGPYWLTFESPPNVELGKEYRTFYPSLSHADMGSFLALWLDGNRLLVKPRHGWCPMNGHVILPGCNDD